MMSGEYDDLSPEVKSILFDYSHLLYASSLSLMEIVNLLNNKKIKTKYKNPESLLEAISAEYFIQILHTKNEHLQTYSRLRIVENHKDPIDHLIISQAICEKIPLISSDRKFNSYISQNLEFIYNRR